jgi:hypothetical protein
MSTESSPNLVIRDAAGELHRFLDWMKLISQNIIAGNCMTQTFSCESVIGLQDLLTLLD